MAPQTSIPVSATVLGTIGTILWCIQLVPQIWTNWRHKQTDGLPSSMMFLWALCGVPFGVYSVVQNFNLPIQVQPQVFMALCLISWVQTLIYPGTDRTRATWRVCTATATGVAIALVFAGVEAALIVTIRPIYYAGNETPVLVIGIVASILLAGGLLPPYGEIWKRRGRVIGINWIFLTMDWCGAFFSLMAVVAQESFDILGGVLYSICCLLELGIFISHIIWLIRTRRIRKEAKPLGKTFDDVAAEHEARGTPFKFAERKSRRELKRQRDKEASDPESGANAIATEAAQAAPGLDGTEEAVRGVSGPTVDAEAGQTEAGGGSPDAGLGLDGNTEKTVGQ